MIHIQNLYKIFHQNRPNAFHALENINLEVHHNHCLILKGVSGSGKSTLLSIIAALQKPTSGEILVDQEAIAKLPDLHASHFRAKSIGFVPQHFNLFENATVMENLSIALIPLGFSPKEIQKKSQQALKFVGIEHKKEARIRDLSGGEKQRTAIARAIVNDAKIILCDEPTANLDQQNSEKFIQLISTLKDEGKTLLIATHDPLFDNLSIVDKIVEMENGKIINAS
jgi:putative ABC transport system ATP-binding protein